MNAPAPAVAPLRVWSLPLWQRLVPLVAVLVAFGVRGARRVEDSDTFWHVAAGRYLAANREFAGPDPFSRFTEGPWVLHQWLPDLVLGVLYSAFGYPGIAWLLPLAVVGIALSVLRACRDRAGLLASALVTAVVLAAMSPAITLRPEVVSLALTPAVATAWLRTADDGRPRWWLLGLAWVWACCHGMWFVAPAIGGAVVIGMALAGLYRERLASLVALVLGTFAVGALTPVGPRLLAVPFQVHDKSVDLIQEWRAPAIGDPALWLVLGLVAVVVVAAVRRRHIAVTHLGLLVLGLAATLVYARTGPIAAGIVAAPAAAGLASLLRYEREPVVARERLVALLAGALVVVVAGVSLIGRADPGNVPSGLDPQLGALPDRTVVCNDYALGGWLILEHPNVAQTVDGRNDIYPLDYLYAARDFEQGLPGWDRFVATTGCHYALVAADGGAARELTSAGWQTIATDHGYLLLRLR